MQRVRPVLVQKSIEEQLAEFPTFDPSANLDPHLIMRRRGFKRTSMTGSFSGGTRFARGISRRKGIRRSVMTASRAAPIIVQAGFTRSAGFFGRFGQGGELKFHDVDLDDATVAAGAVVTDSINKIAQGVTEVQRVGRKCTIRSINWRFTLLLAPATASANTSDTLRILMYLDKQANGATAANTDVLESASYLSFNNLANKGRFRTLMDRTYNIASAAGGGDGTTEDYGPKDISDTFFKKVNIPIEFSAATGAITEIRSNNIGVILLSRAGVIGFASKIRLRFSDG